MGWITLEDTPITLSPNDLAVDQGWSISEGVAYHDPCFPGVIILKNIEVEAGKTYVIDYIVKSYTSGDVYPVIGGVAGTPADAIGKKQDTITVPEDATDLTIYFYSDGELGISYMSIYPVLEDPDNAVTLGFNDDKNRWTTYYKWKPAFMLKFINDLFSWDYDESSLWQHNMNEIRNLFYDVQSYSEIKIIMNVNPHEVKNLYSLRVNSNKAWAVTDIYIRPKDGNDSGQRSVIKKGNFVPINGQFFANFLRDMTDPRFSSQLEALFQGAPLQGTTAEITFRCDETTEVRLVNIDILGSPQQYTF